MRSMIVHPSRIFLFLLLMTIPLSATAQDGEEILAELTELLEMTEEQVPQVQSLLGQFAVDMEAAASLAEVEEPDNQAIMGAIKKARSDLKSGMKGVLDEGQFETLETTLDKIFQEMFEDIAEIRMMDWEPVLDLTEDQVTALKPIIGTGLRDLVALIFEYGDKRLSMPRKVKMGKSAKRIQADMEAGVTGVLNEEQVAKYNAMKEEANK